MSNIWLIRSTFAGKDEAISVARALLEEKLVACANIGESVTALYHWEDMLQQENETVVLFKTTEIKSEATIARIKALHSYKIPSIVAWKADAVDAAFAAWVAAEVA